MKFVRKVGKKGSVTIPKELREVLEVHEGDMVEFEVLMVVHPKDEQIKGSSSTEKRTHAGANPA